MANYEKKIFYVTQEQYDILKNNGTVGSYTGIDSDATYFVRPIPDNYELFWNHDENQIQLLKNGDGSGDPITIQYASYAANAGLLGDYSSSDFVNVSEEQTITGTKTFSSSITVGGGIIGNSLSGYTQYFSSSTNGPRINGRYTQDERYLTLTADDINLSGSVKINGSGVSLSGHTHTKANITDFAHTHGNITNDGAIGTTANLAVITDTNGKLTTRSRSGIDTRSTFPPSSHSHYWSEVIDKPTFATVATSGSYDDLSNKPTIPTIPSVMDTTEGNTGTATTQRTINAVNLKSIILNHSPAGARTPTAHTHGNITNDGAIGTTANLAVITDTNGKLTTRSRSGIDTRSTFPPSSHSHYWSEVIDKPTFATVATSGSYDDLSNKPTIPTIPGILSVSDGTDGTSSAQRTISAINLKQIILAHSPAGARTPTAHTLSSHSDVSTTAPTTGQVLKWNGTAWAPGTDNNTTYSLGSFGVTATAAELNVLDGITATTTELNYTDGVTSNIQTQLNSKAASSHAHGNITSDGLITSTAVTPASGDIILMSDSSNGGKIERGIPLSSVHGDQFLRKDGTWSTPPTPGAASPEWILLGQSGLISNGGSSPSISYNVGSKNKLCRIPSCDVAI